MWHHERHNEWCWWKIHSAQCSNEQMKEEAIYLTKTVTHSIRKWKKHQLRAVHQEIAKTSIMDTLQPHQVYIQLDWAMKFLSSSGKEDQSSWFGKRGITWHISVAYRKDAAENYWSRTFVHVFDQTPQDSVW